MRTDSHIATLVGNGVSEVICSVATRKLFVASSTNQTSPSITPKSASNSPYLLYTCQNLLNRYSDSESLSYPTLNGNFLLAHCVALGGACCNWQIYAFQRDVCAFFSIYLWSRLEAHCVARRVRRSVGASHCVHTATLHCVQQTPGQGAMSHRRTDTQSHRWRS